MILDILSYFALPLILWVRESSPIAYRSHWDYFPWGPWWQSQDWSPCCLSFLRILRSREHIAVLPTVLLQDPGGGNHVGQWCESFQMSEDDCFRAAEIKDVSPFRARVALVLLIILWRKFHSLDMTYSFQLSNKGQILGDFELTWTPEWV